MESQVPEENKELIIYYLDLDFDFDQHYQSPTDKCYYFIVKKFINKHIFFHIKHSNTIPYYKNNEIFYEVFFFNNRQILVDAINHKKPSILLIDLYSKKTNKDSTNKDSTNKNKDNKNELDKNELDKLIISLKDKQSELEDKPKDIIKLELVLSMNNYYQNHASNSLLINHDATGIHEMEEVINTKEIDISFPTALFTRYGRTLMNTGDILKIQNLGGYFVHKEKETKTKDRLLYPTFSLKELRSINDVVSAYESNVQSLGQKQIDEVNIIKELKLKLKPTCCTKLVELFFCLSVILSSAIYGNESFKNMFNSIGYLISHECIKLILDNNIHLFSMLISVILFFILLIHRNKNISLIEKSNDRLSNLINDDIKKREKNNYK